MSLTTSRRRLRVRRASRTTRPAIRTTSATLARGQTATCTITNTLKAAPVVTINKVCPNGEFAGTDRFQPKDGTANAGDALACGESTSYTPTPDSAYNITEAGWGTPAADLANYTTTYSDGCSGTLARGATATCTITNALRPFTVVTYVCEGDQLYASSVTVDGGTKTSLAHNVVLPSGVSEEALCSDITGGARFHRQEERDEDRQRDDHAVSGYLFDIEGAGRETGPFTREWR
jgi:hypothetical protein